TERVLLDLGRFDRFGRDEHFPGSRWSRRLECSYGFFGNLGPSDTESREASGVSERLQASVGDGRFVEREADEAGQLDENGQPGVRDSRTVESERVEILHSEESNKSGIGHGGVRQPQ